MYIDHYNWCFCSSYASVLHYFGNFITSKSCANGQQGKINSGLQMAHTKTMITYNSCIFCQNNMTNLRFLFGSKMASSNKEPCFRRIEFSSQTDKKKTCLRFISIVLYCLKKNNLLSLNNFDSTEDHSKH